MSVLKRMLFRSVKRNDNTPGYVYLIRRGVSSEYKIGLTRNVESRLKQLQTGCPDILQVMHVIWTRDMRNAELSLHNLYSSNRVRGEWFRFSPQHLASVYSSMNGFSSMNGHRKLLNWLLCFRVRNEKISKLQSQVRRLYRAVVFAAFAALSLGLAFSGFSKVTGLSETYPSDKGFNTPTLYGK